MSTLDLTIRDKDVDNDCGKIQRPEYLILTAPFCAPLSLGA